MNRSNRFWLVLGALVTINALVTAVVLLRGDQSDVVPSLVSPADGASGIASRPIIEVRYPRPMDAESLRTAFRIEPPLKGILDIDDSGLTFRTTQALRPGVQYSIVLASGVREASGRASHREVRSQLVARPGRLVVLRQQDGRSSVWLVDPEERNVQRVSEPGDDLTLLAAAPGGDRLAYVTVDADQRWSLWSVSTDGGAPHAIRPGQDGHVGNIAWSPNGDLVAYELNQVYGAQVARPRLWLARTDGSDVALMYGRGQETGSHPTWSPDGRRVAFYENEQRVISIFDFTSRLRAAPAQIDGPVSWAPDGDALAFTDRGGEGGALSLVKIVSLSDMTTRVLPGERGFDGSPTWSPAGDWIAFVRVVAPEAGVWLVRPDGSESHPLTMDSGWTYSAPIWAPDGSALAFSRRPTRVGPQVGEPELWIAPLASKPHQLSLGGRVTDWIP